MAKILVVDDQELQTNMLRECLRSKGHEVAVCHDSTTAERAALEENPDLAIIDYMMPRKTGVELLADLRARKETRLLPVLFISATQAICFTGAIPPEPRVRFISKPLDVGALLTIVDEMLDPNGWSSRGA